MGVVLLEPEPRTEESGVVEVECDMEGRSDSSPEEAGEVVEILCKSGAL